MRVRDDIATNIRHRHPQRNDLRRQRRRCHPRRPRDPRRSHCRPRCCERPRKNRNRCARTGGGARIHQHHEPGAGVSHRRRPRHVRRQAGRHHGNLRRRRLDGTAQSRDEELKTYQTDIKYDIDWTTLGEYLQSLVRRGVSPNVGSFLGAATPRMYVLGSVNRAPTPDELEQMRAVVRQAMREGAFGVASALIYAPGAYATTDEMIELSKAAAPFGGMYISHMRSEGNRLLEAVDELITIAREAGRSRRDLSPQSCRENRTGRRWTRSFAASKRRARRTAHHRRHVHLHRRRDGPRCGDAAVGAGGRLRRVAQATSGSGDSRAGARGDARSECGVGKPDAPRRLARSRAARRHSRATS